MSNTGFTRWYDRDPQLSQAVRMMEASPLLHQRVIARAMLHMADLSHLTLQAETGIKKAGSRKIVGLMKSQAKRRWYDLDPDVHRAFNNLFMMDDKQRTEMAIRIIISLKALENYRPRPGYLGGQESHELLILSKAIFARDAEYLMSQANIYALPPQAIPKERTKAPAPKPPAPKPTPVITKTEPEKPRPPKDRRVVGDESGMRVTKLKMES